MNEELEKRKLEFLKFLKEPREEELLKQHYVDYVALISKSQNYIKVVDDKITLNEEGKKLLREVVPLDELLEEGEQTHIIFDKYAVVDDTYLVLVYALNKDFAYIPLIATSKGNLIRIKNREQEYLEDGYKPSEIPPEEKYYYFEYAINDKKYFFKLKNEPEFDDRFEITNISNKALKMLVDKEKIDKSKLFGDIINIIKEYWDHNTDEEYEVIASLVILSYIEGILGKTIYLMLQGKEDTGKSTLQKLVSKLQFYGFFSTQNTIKVAVRYVDFYGVKIGFDDFEKLDKKTKSEVIGILNSGLYRSGTYNIVNTESKDIRKSIISFSTFGFKSFSCNYTDLFESSFLSRCYPLVCVRQARKLKDIYDVETIEEDKPRFQGIVDRCFAYCVLNWKEIVNSIKEEKKKLEDENIFGRVTDRNSVILGIIKHFKPDTYENIKKLLKDKEGLGKKEELETLGGNLLWTLAELFKQKEKEEKETLTISNKELVNSLQEDFGFSDEDKRKYAIRIANLLKNTYKLIERADQIQKDGKTTKYIIYKSTFLDTLKRFGYNDIYLMLEARQDNKEKNVKNGERGLDVNISEMSEMSKASDNSDNSDNLITNPVSKEDTDYQPPKSQLRQLLDFLDEKGTATPEELDEAGFSPELLEKAKYLGLIYPLPNGAYKRV